MKFARFSIEGKHIKGVIHDGVIKEISGDLFGDWKYTGDEYCANDVKWLSPLVPNQIIGIGANYVARMEDLPRELPEIPVFFFKPTSSVIGPEEQIVIPEGIDRVKFESELAM